MLGCVRHAYAVVFFVMAFSLSAWGCENQAVIAPDTDGSNPTEASDPAFSNDLFDNYPNPFNSVTTIMFNINDSAHVSLRVYNGSGGLVATLVDAVRDAGPSSATWNGKRDNGSEVGPGIYSYVLVTKNFSQAKKMVLTQ